MQGENRMRARLLNIPLGIRFALFTALLLVGLSTSLYLAVSLGLERSMNRDQEIRAVSLARLTGRTVGPWVEANDVRHVQGFLTGLNELTNGFVVIRRADGSQVAAVHGEREGGTLPPLADKPLVAFRPGMVRVDTVLPLSDGSSGRVTLGLSLNHVDTARHELHSVLITVLGAFLVLGVLSSFIVGRWLLRPLRAMISAARRIAQGDLSQKPLDMHGSDEIGQLAEAFDHMLDVLRALADGMEKMGRGDLTARVDAEGEVASAFNRMCEHQRSVLGQIAEAALKLAGAATQLYELVQRQEEATARQAAGVEEVSRTMQSLLDSASNIAEAAHGVFDNAQRTRQTTESMAGHVLSLTGHTNRIAELLEVIRDIADRSDLLALNASLEATRAGEAGRAFSLVASEMRRLAERITASVQDVKTLLVDIRSAGTSSAVATDESRKLAESTTDSAHHITMVTQQQRTATGQVLESMREIGNILSGSVGSSRESRASVELLRTTADQFRLLVGKFKTEHSRGSK